MEGIDLFGWRLSVTFAGRSNDRALFVFDNLAVVVDEAVGLVVEKGSASALLASAVWTDQDVPPAAAVEEIAHASVTSLDIEVFKANDRMYTIPKAVQLEAQRALEWRKKHKRGGTPVGMNTARTLAKGGQVGLKKIRHIAKYFPRHEVDKKGSGYKPGTSEYPSAGRIAWGLWGGDAAQRWATAIVERENKKAVTAAGWDAPYTAPVPVALDHFDHAMAAPVEEAPEFFIRLRLDNTGIDRLYMLDADNFVHVWDDGAFDELCHMEHDFDTYDATLDDPYDDAEKIVLSVDPETAVKIAAMFDADPFGTFGTSDLDPEEVELVEAAFAEIDWDFIDEVLVAAGVNPNDSIYSPEERSKNASRQVRDATGRFAQSGSRVVIGGDTKKRGVIKKVNPDDKSVSVEMDDGSQVKVPAASTQREETYSPQPIPPTNDDEFDPTGILGEPRTPIGRGKDIRLPGTMPPLDADSISTLLNDWPSWVADQRASGEKVQKERKDAIGVVDRSNNPDDSIPVPGKIPGRRKYDKPQGWDPLVAPNAYNEPMLREWLKNPRNKRWYNPILRKNPSYIKVAPVKAAGAPALTPETSDVPPIYMAIVANDDPQAVMELVSLVPASAESTTPTIFKREPGKWVPDEAILADLQSPTPPPVVVLDSETLAAVVDQIDGDAAEETTDTQPVAAAGGLDRNRGNAEKLRRYWTIGEGGAKIRWGTKGDWSRCVRLLSKHLGVRAKGYCALRHKEMTGMWTGDKAHREMYGRKNFSTDFVKSEEQIIEEALLAARAADAKARIQAMVAGAAMPIPMDGKRFCIPLVIPEGVETGDGRKFKEGAITMRDLPLPLLWQIKTGSGHDGSVVVGRIDTMERIEGGIGNAYGYFDTGEYGREAQRLVERGFLRGISADLDNFEGEEEAASEADEKKVGGDKMTITKARIMAVTLVPKPAFQECYIEMADDAPVEEETVIPDGIYVEDVDPIEASALVACGMVAGAIPVTPPASWFENPRLTKPTPLTVDDEGRVFGHIASWDMDHIGLAYGTRPPKSRSNYAYFHTGVVRTDEGTDIPVGQLTLAGGHASLELSAADAVRHYDDTASAIADVHAGEDAYGIWVAGALRPGTQPEQIRALRASAPSGDWRPIKGRLELVAVCQVNVPGFPVARARVASGAVMALVAAGASTLAKMKDDPFAELQTRVSDLEAAQKAPLVSAADEARRRVYAAKAAELSARVRKSEPQVTVTVNTTLNAEEIALSVMDRLRAYKARAIVAAAKAEDEKDPNGLIEGEVDPKAAAPEEEPVAEMPEADKVGDLPKYNAKTQPRDSRGRFREVLARIKQDLGDSGNAEALKQIQEIENFDFAGDYEKASKSSEKLIDIIDRLDTKALNPEALENVRLSARELGKVIANLPFAFGQDAEKFRYSDVPPTMKDLLEGMIKRVEEKIGTKDAAVATAAIKSFMSGGDLMNQADLSKELSKLLRLLT